MRVLTLKTRTPANIKIPGYPKYTIKFKQWSFRSIRGKRDTKRELREHIYHIYIGNLNRAFSPRVINHVRALAGVQLLRVYNGDVYCSWLF